MRVSEARPRERPGLASARIVEDNPASDGRSSRPGRTERIGMVATGWRDWLPERKAGRSLAAIADMLNDEQVPTAQGGRRWWASTVRCAANH